MPNNCSVLHRPSTRIDAQYEIGLFLCPSVNHIVGIHELVPYTKLAIFAICNKCIRLSFPHFICSEGEYYDCLATREMAAVLASYRVQENLPKIAKLHNDMLNSNPAMQSASSSAITLWLNSDNSLFSAIVESTVPNRQVLLMAHACLAFSTLLCAASLSPMATLLCLAWFVWSLSLCVKGGLQ